MRDMVFHSIADRGGGRWPKGAAGKIRVEKPLPLPTNKPVMTWPEGSNMPVCPVWPPASWYTLDLAITTKDGKLGLELKECLPVLGSTAPVTVEQVYKGQAAALTCKGIKIGDRLTRCGNADLRGSKTFANTVSIIRNQVVHLGETVPIQVERLWPQHGDPEGMPADQLARLKETYKKAMADYTGTLENIHGHHGEEYTKKLKAFNAEVERVVAHNAGIDQRRRDREAKRRAEERKKQRLQREANAKSIDCLELTKMRGDLMLFGSLLPVSVFINPNKRTRASPRKDLRTPLYKDNAPGMRELNAWKDTCAEASSPKELLNSLLALEEVLAHTQSDYFEGQGVKRAPHIVERNYVMMPLFPTPIPRELQASPPTSLIAARLYSLEYAVSQLFSADRAAKSIKKRAAHMSTLSGLESVGKRRKFSAKGKQRKASAKSPSPLRPLSQAAPGSVPAAVTPGSPSEALGK